MGADVLRQTLKEFAGPRAAGKSLSRAPPGNDDVAMCGMDDLDGAVAELRGAHGLGRHAHDFLKHQRALISRGKVRASRHQREVGREAEVFGGGVGHFLPMLQHLLFGLDSLNQGFRQRPVPLANARYMSTTTLVV